jgi:hypothetical protein
MGTIVRAKSEMFAQQLIMNDERRMMNDEVVSSCHPHNHISSLIPYPSLLCLAPHP